MRNVIRSLGGLGSGLFAIAMTASAARAQLAIGEIERRVIAGCSVSGVNGCHDGGHVEHNAEGPNAFRDSVEVHTTQCSGAGALTLQTSSVSASIIQFSANSSVGVSAGNVYESTAQGDAIARLQFHVGALLDYESTLKVSSTTTTSFRTHPAAWLFLNTRTELSKASRWTEPDPAQSTIGVPCHPATII